jgi:hypothetical protein
LTFMSAASAGVAKATAATADTMIFLICCPSNQRHAIPAASALGSRLLFPNSRPLQVDVS